jgi:type I restriction enzyme S subunit
MEEKFGWITTELNQVAEIIMGQSPPSSTYNENDIGLPFFQGKAEFTELYPIVSKWCSEPNKIAESNDILISVRAPVGATNIANQKCCIGRGLAAIRYPDCNKYVFYFLRLIEKELDKKGTGTTFKAISGSVLKSEKIPLAPLPEQRVIVSKIEQLFSELDNGISNLKLAQEQLKVYRQAVLKKAFEGELTKKWREQQTDLPDAGDLLEQIRKEREEATKSSDKKGKKSKPPTGTELADLPMIPKKWMWVKLDYLGDLGRGKSKHRPRNDKILFGGKYPFIQTGEVKAANHTIKSFEKTYSDFGLAQSKLWPKGTLCITIAANIAETAFLGFDGCFPDSIVGFTATENIIMKEYIYYFFKVNQSKIEAFAPATAQKNINLNTLENLIVPYCSLLEQKAIVQEIETRLSVCDKIEQDIETNLEKAEALRQSILKKAFEGKLLNERELAEVRGAEDWEPAEVLLKRIRAERVRNGKK